LKSNKLELLTTKIGSGVTPRGGASVYQNSGVHLIRSQNIYNHRFEMKGIVCISEEIATKMKSVEVMKDDILINITGDSVARTYLVPDEILPARVNQHVCILRTKPELNPHYLYYFLINPVTQNYLLNISGIGGTRNALTKDMLSNLIVEYPDCQTQEKIITQLNAIKNKIIILEKENKVLEQTAQTIFKSWFVDFDGQTEFIDSELGQIPKGWFASNLSNVCEKITDGSHYSPKENLNGTNKIATVKNMQEYNFDFDSCKKISDQDFKQLVKNSCNPETGDVLLSKDGTMGLSMFFYNSQPLVLLSSIAILKPNVGLNFYLKSFLSRSEIVDELIGGHASGSALPRIVLKDLKEFKITIPDEQTLKKFNKLAEQIFKQLFKNSCFIYNLSKIRDSLLPKLMSGELVN
jgi:type I restriction enzyme S subunit